MLAPTHVEAAALESSSASSSCPTSSCPSSPPQASYGPSMLELSQIDEPASKHVIFVSTHFRSHFRPFLFTALSIVGQYAHIYITIYVVDEVLAIVDEEKALFHSVTLDEGAGRIDGQGRASERVRVIGLKQRANKSDGGMQARSQTLRGGTQQSPSSQHPDLQAADWSASFDLVYASLPDELLSYKWKSTAGGKDDAFPTIAHRRHADEVAGTYRDDTHATADSAIDDAYLTKGREAASHEEDQQDGRANDPLGFAIAPSSLVFDFLLDIPSMIDDMSPTTKDLLGALRLVAYSPGPAAWALRRLTAPDIADKLASVDRILDKNDFATQVDSTARICDILTHTDGSIIDVEGCFQCYDYELMPQLGSMKFDWTKFYLVCKAASTMLRCHSVMFSTSPDLEPGVIHLLRAALGKPVYQIGPQFPPNWWKSDMTNYAADNAEVKVQRFLDDAQRRLGRDSVLYVSFGSVYAMDERPDMLEHLMSVLLEINRTTQSALPFVFATVTTSSMIREDLQRQAEASGAGIFCHFAPQHLILRHAATGWFLTHGGANGVHEAIINRVPLILWPATTDQPVAAAQLSVTLGCGVELIQVRTGPSCGQMTMRGVRHLGGATDAIRRELKNVLSSVVEARLGQEPLGDAAQRVRNVRFAVESMANTMIDSHSSATGECKTAFDNFVAHL